MIADALEINQNIESVNLAYNNIEWRGGMAFVTVLRLNPKIISLELGGNDIPLQVMKEIKRA
eukprot:CAMPEP_0115000904 /NCGR_PEP_ID=MMETSP0216-20121206/17043_1 /TAXON_ID=223996 /ORGANISM="Protocruzia adherens, Strain Boccale" /LENGTH=61 /DNA_ID=CAMNT_0002366107 /DNA_START=419 /DNA_END=600 /DNA_ORIENTATION=+